MTLNEEQRKVLHDLAHHDPIINAGLHLIDTNQRDLVPALIEVIRAEAEARQSVLERLEKLICEGPQPILLVRDVTPSLPPPRFTHDCNACQFMGQYQEYDLWVCPKTGLGPSLIARFDSEGSKYASFDLTSFLTFCAVLPHEAINGPDPKPEFQKSSALMAQAEAWRRYTKTQEGIDSWKKWLFGEFLGALHTIAKWNNLSETTLLWDLRMHGQFPPGADVFPPKEKAIVEGACQILIAKP